MLKHRNINIFEYIATSAFSTLFCIFIYKYLYEIFTYTNLDDFYVGTSIYTNHNKYLDIWMFFIYIGTFFLFLPLVNFLSSKIPKLNIDITNIKPLKFNIEKIAKFQYIFLLGYALLHPFDGNFYPKVAILISIFIIIAIIDIRKREEKTISPSALAPILFLFFYISNTYAIQEAPIDDHHIGEQLATYFLHEKFSLEYYKDIMLVHGFKDVIPPLIGQFFFGEISLYTYNLGVILTNNLTQILSLILGLIIFSQNYIFITPLLIAKPELSILYICTYILLINQTFIKNKLLWLIGYILITFIFMLNWTTVGTFYLIATIPFALYLLARLIKENSKYRSLKCIILVLLITILFFISKDLMLNYIEQAKYYIQGNLFAFGNNFGNYNFSIEQTINYSIKIFVVLIFPFLIIELAKEFYKKEKDINYISTLIFLIILPIASLNYMLGRLDGEDFRRIWILSSSYLFVAFPFCIYYKEKNNKNIIFLLQILLIIILLNTGLKIYNNPPQFIYKYKGNTQEKIEGIGNLNLTKLDEIRIKNIKSFVEKNSDKNDYFLDLTNRGMNYLYVKRQIPIPYTSYFNSISTKQDLFLLDKLKKNQPKIILIGYYSGKYNITSPIFDNVKPALRLPNTIKWLIVDGNYKLKVKNDIVYLIKTEKINTFNENEIRILDELFAQENLKYLPKSWGNSLETLPIIEDKKDFTIVQSKNDIKITFKTPENGFNIDFLCLKNLEEGDYKVTIGDNKYTQYFSKKSNGLVLIPMYNVPSFLLNTKIKEIKIEAKNEMKNKIEVSFYKRKMT